MKNHKDRPPTDREARELLKQSRERTNKPKIVIYGRDVYGTFRFYPSDQNAHLFCNLTGKTTLTPQHLDTIRELGFRVEVIESEAQRVARCGQ